MMKLKFRQDGLMRTVFSVAAVMACFSILGFALQPSVTTRPRIEATPPVQPPQLPLLLAAYTQRPDHPVAGVDYYVGNRRTDLGRWQDLRAAPVLAVTPQSGRIDVGGSGVIQGVDFSGSWIYVSSKSSLIFRDCVFGASPVGIFAPFVVQSPQQDVDVTFTDCTFDGANVDQSTFISFAGRGRLEVTYCYFARGGQHRFELNGSVQVVDRRNLITEMGTMPGAHENWMQWGLIGPGSSAEVIEDTTYKSFTSPAVFGGEGLQFYGNNGGSLDVALCKRNVFIYRGVDTGSNVLHGAPAVVGICRDNWFDVTGSIYHRPLDGVGAFYPGSFGGWTVEGNVNLLNGQAVSPQ